jgi:hypothetical protein
MKKTKIKKEAYQKTLLTLLGVTRVFAKADIRIPSKWLSFLNSLRASSELLHLKLSRIDREVEDEFIWKEEMIEKRLGTEAFYSEEELEDLKDNREKIKV